VKRIAFLILALYYLTLSGQTTNVQSFRKLLYESYGNESIARKFHKETRFITNTHPAILQGFKSMSEFMLCAHLSAPWDQLSLFYKGKNQLEAAIKSDPHNAELRYFRFITQTNVPSILGYKNDIESDKIVLIAFLKANSGRSERDHDLFIRIKNYLLQSYSCDENEKKLIRNL
jgi:hypothetical protein